MDREEMLERLAGGEDALEISIRKWEDIVAGKGKNEGASNCALCEKYGCLICPVQKITHKSGCLGTPIELLEHVCHCTLKEKKALEIAELLFLKAVRKGSLRDCFMEERVGVE